MQERWGRIATLMWVLSFTTIVSWALTIDGVPFLMIPGGILAAECLRRIASLLDRPAGRRHLEWAAVAAGGVVVSTALMLPESSRDMARVANFASLSIGITLYALGLAAWTAPVGDGKVARYLRVSVVVWWATVGLYAVAFALGTDNDDVGGWTFVYDGRQLPDAWMVPVVTGFVVAFWMLARYLHVIRTTMKALAEEPAPAPESELV